MGFRPAGVVVRPSRTWEGSSGPHGLGVARGRGVRNLGWMKVSVTVSGLSWEAEVDSPRGACPLNEVAGRVQVPWFLQFNQASRQ